MTKTRIFQIATVLLLTVGVLSLLYPVASNLIHVAKQKKIIKEYNEHVQQMTSEETDQILDEAREYNKKLANPSTEATTDENAVSGNLAYRELLQVMGEQMGYIVIPAIDVDLPIFHYTSDDVLSVGIGHLENSSLPVGGESTHCVLTGHSGLIQAKLFTDLEKLVVGDKFYIKTLNETLCYQVDQILTVLPYDTSQLKIIQGRDLVTLITCTPYGVNSHRLLVRGTRVEYQGEIDEPVVEEPKETEPVKEIYSQDDFADQAVLTEMWIPIIVFVTVLIGAILLFLFFRSRKQKRTRKRNGGYEA